MAQRHKGHSVFIVRALVIVSKIPLALALFSLSHCSCKISARMQHISAHYFKRVECSPAGVTVTI